MPLSIFNDPLLEPSTRWTIGPGDLPGDSDLDHREPRDLWGTLRLLRETQPTLRLFKRGTFHQGKWMEVEHPFFSKPCLNMTIIMIKELNGPCSKNMSCVQLPGG